jgi:hypothetical protein
VLARAMPTFSVNLTPLPMAAAAPVWGDGKTWQQYVTGFWIYLGSDTYCCYVSVFKCSMLFKIVTMALTLRSILEFFELSFIRDIVARETTSASVSLTPEVVLPVI